MCGRANRHQATGQEQMRLHLDKLKHQAQSKNCHQKSSHQASRRCEGLLASGPILVTKTVIHKFSQLVVVNREVKVVENKNKRSEIKRVNSKECPKKKKYGLIEINFSDADKHLKDDLYGVGVIANNKCIDIATTLMDCVDVVGNIQKNIQLCQKEELTVYNLGDVYYGRRVKMDHLGIDVGTKTIVLAYRSGEKVEYISEINGYYPFERCTPFIKNMLNDPNKVRSDGTKRPARWFELDGKAIVLGRDAEEFAYAKNDTLLRPMAEGGIAADEEAMTVLAAIVQGLMTMAEHEIGKFSEEVKLCYCTTAKAINKESNIDYHQRVVNLVIEGYDTKAKLSYNSIKESHAIVIDMSDDGTGIGISWGAGTVTVSYVKYGLEVYSFCWVGAGDWIDTQVAMRHGYDPNALNTMKKKAKETPTTVAKKKTEVDLTPGVDYSDDRLAMDIVLHYDVLINQVIEGIVAGFQQNEAEARIEDAIPIYMAGGTSSPTGFVERCATKLEQLKPPFAIGEMRRAGEPLYSVATGCLKAAEMF